MKTSRHLFARLLVIAKSRDVNLMEVLCHSLDVYLLLLCTPSGFFVKTVKSKLSEIIEDLAENPVVHLKSFQENALIMDVL